MKTEQVDARFVSLVPGLSELKDLCPKPSKAFVPQWFKDMPYGELKTGSDVVYSVKTAKQCPALPDMFSQGYVIPMWVDTVIRYSQDSGRWEWVSSDVKNYKWDIHSTRQFIDHVSTGVSFNGSSADFIFKALCPWRLITPKGYSSLQLPLFYHFDKQFSVMPGVIHTDIHHEINQQVLYHGGGEEVFIKRGTPFVQYVPFKRSNFNLCVSDASDEDVNYLNAKELDLYSSFSGSYLRSKRDHS